MCRKLLRRVPTGLVMPACLFFSATSRDRQYLERRQSLAFGTGNECSSTRPHSLWKLTKPLGSPPPPAPRGLRVGCRIHSSHTEPRHHRRRFSFAAPLNRMTSQEFCTRNTSSDFLEQHDVAGTVSDFIGGWMVSRQRVSSVVTGICANIQSLCTRMECIGIASVSGDLQTASSHKSKILCSWTGFSEILSLFCCLRANGERWRRGPWRDDGRVRERYRGQEREYGLWLRGRERVRRWILIDGEVACHLGGRFYFRRLMLSLRVQRCLVISQGTLFVRLSLEFGLLILENKVPTGF